MNVLILGGNSKRHYQWIRDLKDALVQHGHTVRIHDYAHWSNGQENADIEHEIKRLETELHDFTGYAVIAKSVGTVIATLAGARGAILPRRYLLLGVPIGGIASQTEPFQASLQSLSGVTIVQNEFDPYGTYDELTAYLANTDVDNVHTICVKGNETHDYIDFEAINTLIASSN